MAFATATEQPHAVMKAWSFSASPTATTFNAESSSNSSAAANPLALLTPGGKHITAPLLKMICHSSPSSWIASSTLVSLGCQVATIDRPSDKGVTSRRRNAAMNSTGGGAPSGRSSAVDGR